MIHIHYFASIRERLGSAGEQVQADPELGTVAALVARLVTVHGAAWDEVLRGQRVLMAVNQTVARADTPLRDGDEVAFFPPVTGG